MGSVLPGSIHGILVVEERTGDVPCRSNALLFQCDCPTEKENLQGQVIKKNSTAEMILETEGMQFLRQKKTIDYLIKECSRTKPVLLHSSPNQRQDQSLALIKHALTHKYLRKIFCQYCDDTSTRFCTLHNAHTSVSLYWVGLRVV